MVVFLANEVKWSESYSVVFETVGTLQPHGLYSPWNSPGQNVGVDSLSLLQGIFLTQGSNPDLPHCRKILYQLSHQGSSCGWWKGLIIIIHWISCFAFALSFWVSNIHRYFKDTSTLTLCNSMMAWPMFLEARELPLTFCGWSGDSIDSSTHPHLDLSSSKSCCGPLF